MSGMLVNKEVVPASAAAAHSGEYVTVANFVGNFELGRCLPLTKVNIAIGSSVDFSVFASMISRNADVHTTSSIFCAGNSSVSGCKTENHALITAYLMRDTIFHKTGILVSVVNFKICNLVCRVEFPYSVPKATRQGEPMPPTGGLRLSMLINDARVHPATVDSEVHYNPDVFLGLRWRVRLPHPDGSHNPHGQPVTFVLFERARGVATGLLAASDRHLANAFIGHLPSYERGNEYRDPTPDELEFEARIEKARARHKERGHKQTAVATAVSTAARALAPAPVRPASQFMASLFADPPHPPSSDPMFVWTGQALPDASQFTTDELALLEH